MRRLGFVLLISLLGSNFASAQTLKLLNSFNHADPEINAYDIGSQRTFVTKAGSAEIDVLSSGFNLVQSIDISSDIASVGEINSVAAKNNIVAVAGKNLVGTSNGSVAFYDATTLNFLGSANVGANPDMVTFTPDGTQVIVANEGEPNDDYTIDPVGSVSIIDVSTFSVTNAGFSSFNGTSAGGARIFGPGASVEQDLEPEYISVSEDGTKAYITLQENNAYATLDIASGTITDVRSFGVKDHSLAGNGFDASNRDGIDGNIQTHPVFGMYQPDAIASYNVGGTNYLVSANEGDARDYGGFSEEVRIADLALDLNNNGIDDDIDDNGVLDNSLAIYDDDAELGRLKTTTATGDIDNDGLIEEIHTYGARSFSIWDADTGSLVFDSGDDFEQIIDSVAPQDWVDGRSDDKGPEPESVVIGEALGKTFAFIGLERTGGIMIYDITDPNAPLFANFISLSDSGISSPEGLTFISASDSPTGEAMLIVSNEFEANGNTQTLMFSVVPEPGSFLFLGGLSALAFIRRRR